MNLPPKHRPKRRADVLPIFAADPFDKRFRTQGQEWTPLGELVQCYYELRRCIKRECPDVLEFLDKHGDLE